VFDIDGVLPIGKGSPPMHRNDCEPLPFWQTVSVLLIRARMRLGRWARSFLRPGSYTVAGFVAVYSVSQLLKLEEIPRASAWTSHHPLGWILAVSGIGALLGTLLVFVGFSRVLKKQEQNDELAEACRGLWVFVTETLGIEMNKVGVHVWSVKGLKGFRYLQRRATFVIEQRRRTHVIWWKGKGAIGVAWEDDDPKIANVEHLHALGPTRDEFCAIPAAERFGMSWREFRRTSHYRAILAIPLRANGKVRGVLSVDIQVDGMAYKLDTLSNDPQFNNVLTVCEAVLR
jgi:hypothetical protein